MAFTDEIMRDDVQTFHKAMDLTIGNFLRPTVVDRHLRAELIREEMSETISAVERGDMLETIDGIGDAYYVTHGALVTFGIHTFPWSFLAPVGGAKPSLQPLRFLRFHLLEVSLAAQVAIQTGDLTHVAERLDVLLGALSVAVTRLRVDFAPFWREIQRANMAKVGGPIRADGKRLKPAGWTPPDHRVIYESLYGPVPELAPMPEELRLIKTAAIVGGDYAI